MCAVMEVCIPGKQHKIEFKIYMLFHVDKMYRTGFPHMNCLTDLTWLVFACVPVFYYKYPLHTLVQLKIHNYHGMEGK